MTTRLRRVGAPKTRAECTFPYQEKAQARDLGDSERRETATVYEYYTPYDAPRQDVTACTFTPSSTLRQLLDLALALVERHEELAFYHTQRAHRYRRVLRALQVLVPETGGGP